MNRASNIHSNGKTAALYLYSYKSHQPAAKETELDQWARWTAWLDIYVKHAGQAMPKAVVCHDRDGAWARPRGPFSPPSPRA